MIDSKFFDIVCIGTFCLLGAVQMEIELQSSIISSHQLTLDGDSDVQIHQQSLRSNLDGESKSKVTLYR